MRHLDCGGSLPKPAPPLKESDNPETPSNAQTDDAGLDSDIWLRVYRKSLRAHPSIEHSLKYFKRMFDEAPAAFIVTSCEMQIADANHAAQKLLQGRLGDIREKPLSTMVARADRMAFRSMARQLLDDPTVMTRPLRLQPLSGDPIDVLFKAVATRDSDGNPECVYWLFLDPLHQGNGELV